MLIKLFKMPSDYLGQVDSNVVLFCSLVYLKILERCGWLIQCVLNPLREGGNHIVGLVSAHRCRWMILGVDIAILKQLTHKERQLFFQACDPIFVSPAAPFSNSTAARAFQQQLTVVQWENSTGSISVTTSEVHILTLPDIL